MGLKKRAKVSAQFNMSSLTDIIFLLLIFFMLTSTLVAPNALNLKLPGSSNASTTTSEAPNDVRITRRGSFYLDGKKVSVNNLERSLRSMVRKDPDLTITISPEDAKVEDVVAVMDMAMRFQINAILAAEEE